MDKTTRDIKTTREDGERGDLETKRDEMDVNAEINRDRCRNQDRDRHGEKAKGGRRKETRRERE